MKAKKNRIAMAMLISSMVAVFMVLFSSQKIQAAEYEGVDYSAVFDAEYYYEHNTDLQAVYQSTDVEGLLQHFINYGMAEGRQASAQFNAADYRSLYADLDAAYGDNWTAYYEHYINYGKNEGRSGVIDLAEKYAAVFNAENYLNRNTDLRSVFGDDTEAALEHFINYGISEGRQAINTFDVRAYKKANPDLEQAFGDDYMAYVNHYINYGQYENRVTTDSLSTTVSNDNLEDTYASIFDATYYAENNSDVVAVYGTDSSALFAHFLQYGMAEGRQGSEEFNVYYYQRNNSDLQKAFGDDLKAYYQHYVYYGKSEGRIGSAANAQLQPLSETGIDVSYHQGTIDWDAVKSDSQNIGYVLIRVGLGDDEEDQDDAQFAYNVSECERLGIPYGVYLVSYAVTDAQANSEISHILRLLDGHNPVMGVYIDMENTNSTNNTHGGINPYTDANRVLLTNITVKILKAVSAKGYITGVYANIDYYQNVLYADQLSGFRWIAGYVSDSGSDSSTKETTVKSLGASIWQYTNKGTVSGISGYVDMNKIID